VPPTRLEAVALDTGETAFDKRARLRQAATSKHQGLGWAELGCVLREFCATSDSQQQFRFVEEEACYDAQHGLVGCVCLAKLRGFGTAPREEPQTSVHVGEGPREDASLKAGSVLLVMSAQGQNHRFGALMQLEAHVAITACGLDSRQFRPVTLGVWALGSGPDGLHSNDALLSLLPLLASVRRVPLRLLCVADSTAQLLEQAPRHLQGSCVDFVRDCMCLRVCADCSQKCVCSQRGRGI
jgi:hypothetical protein